MGSSRENASRIALEIRLAKLNWFLSQLQGGVRSSKPRDAKLRVVVAITKVLAA